MDPGQTRTQFYWRPYWWFYSHSTANLLAFYWGFYSHSTLYSLSTDDSTDYSTPFLVHCILLMILLPFYGSFYSHSTDHSAPTLLSILLPLHSTDDSTPILQIFSGRNRRRLSGGNSHSLLLIRYFLTVLRHSLCCLNFYSCVTLHKNDYLPW